MKTLKKLLVISFATIGLLACDDIIAKPSVVLNSNDAVNQLVSSKDVTDYYDNNYKAVYDAMVTSGSSNTEILNALVKMISKKETPKAYGFKEDDYDKIFNNVLKELNPKNTTKEDKEAYTGTDAEKACADNLEKSLVKQLKKAMIEKANTSTYEIDGLFQEEKLINELKASSYAIDPKEDENGKDIFKNDVLVLPGTIDKEYEQMFSADYTKYIEGTMLADVHTQLLTSSYLYTREFSSIGRAYARKVQYIKLDALKDYPSAVTQILSKYFDDAKTTGFDLNELMARYKGFTLRDNTFDASRPEGLDEFRPEDEETGSNYVKEDASYSTKYTEIATDMTKVVYSATDKDKGQTRGELLATTDTSRDETLISEYTGSYAYLPEHGAELKLRSLAKENYTYNVEEEIEIKSGGASSLPSDLKERVFSSSFESYCDESDYTFADDESDKKVNFLVSKTYINNGTETEDMTKYAYYDTSSSAWYITIVDQTNYNTAYFEELQDTSKEVNASKKYEALEIARLIGKTATNQKNAIVYFLDMYDLDFGDQNFYDYIEETYEDVLDDNYSYNDEAKKYN